MQSVVASPTTKLVSLDGVTCRVWNATTLSGRRLILYVHRLACEDEAEVKDLEGFVYEVPPPQKEQEL
jgi:hypothetical protein